MTVFIALKSDGKLPQRGIIWVRGQSSSLFTAMGTKLWKNKFTMKAHRA